MGLGTGSLSADVSFAKRPWPAPGGQAPPTVLVRVETCVDELNLEKS